MHLFRNLGAGLLLTCFAYGNVARGETPQHGFLACGSQTYIVNGHGKKIWTFEHGTRDGYVLPDGEILLTLNRSSDYPGGAVVLASQKAGAEPKLVWQGTQAEVNSAQPTAMGTIVLTEAGPQPRLIEVDRTGKVLVEFPLECQLENHHMQTRMARKLADGSYLAPHLLDFAVRRYDHRGKVLDELRTAMRSEADQPLETWPFTAIRHGQEQTLVCLTHGNRVVDFDRNGAITWQLSNDDLPGPWLQDPCGAQVLDNGNIVVTSYAAGQADPAAPKLLEVTRDKQVVWTYSDDQAHGIHHFQILDSDGEPLSSPPLK
jgi:hypothetical protein